MFHGFTPSLAVAYLTTNSTLLRSDLNDWSFSASHAFIRSDCLTTVQTRPGLSVCRVTLVFSLSSRLGFYSDLFRFSSYSLCTDLTENTDPLFMWVTWNHVFHVATLAAWLRMSWQHRFPQPSYCCLTSQMSRRHCVFRAIASQRSSLLIKLSGLSADTPHCSLLKDVRPE
jgi:hypothetical protein